MTRGDIFVSIELVSKLVPVIPQIGTKLVCSIMMKHFTEYSEIAKPPGHRRFY
jgi:hypothetical protein